MERPEKMLMYLIGHTGFAVLYALLITLRKELDSTSAKLLHYFSAETRIGLIPGITLIFL
jgi:hypothetical protein